MPISAADFAAFLQLIDHIGSKNEVACGRYLQYAGELLCRRTPRAILRIIQEDRTHYGNSDCIVVADIDNGRGGTERYAVLWEVKAPQCALMKFDGNARRCTPTNDLLKAENQLMHYASELQGNDAFRARNGIVHRENIILGGIVIGRDGRLAEDNSHPNNEHYADLSLAVREKYFYINARFVVWTWDEIKRFLDPNP